MCIGQSQTTNLSLPPDLSHKFFFSFLFFWPSHTACGILVPQPGIEPRLSAVIERSPNHWTPREFPISLFSKSVSLFYFVNSSISFFFIPHISKVVWYLSFSVWLTSLSNDSIWVQSFCLRGWNCPGNGDNGCTTLQM